MMKLQVCTFEFRPGREQQWPSGSRIRENQERDYPNGSRKAQLRPIAGVLRHSSHKSQGITYVNHGPSNLPA